MRETIRGTLALGCLWLALTLASDGFTGACYCRAAGTVRWCAADMTERACRDRCTGELCDDWFWIERRPCWNWGYGG
jgi:hypothetical protein